MVWRDNLAETLVRLTEQRLTRGEEIDELLRDTRTAQGPETAPDSAGHDDKIIMIYAHMYI